MRSHFDCAPATSLSAHRKSTNSSRDKKKERQGIQVDGTFDIEVEGWQTFVCGGLLDLRPDGQGYEQWDWREEDAMVERLLGFAGTVYAHNTGRFDSLWFASHLARRGLRAVPYLAGQRIVRLVVGDLSIVDSAAIIPLPLSEACKLGSTQKIATGLLCRCGRRGGGRNNPITTELRRQLDRAGIAYPRSLVVEGCGGYCSIRRDMSATELRQCMDYMRVDCEAIASALDGLSAFAAEHDLDLATTIGAASWRTVRRRLEIPRARWENDRVSPGALYSYIRDGYFGGRVQGFARTATAGWRWDVNSAYPYAMSQLAMPDGEMREAFARRAGADYASGREGIYRAIVNVPEQHIPPLPLRTDERVAYPWGRFGGTWTGLELRYAESRGAVVEQVTRAVTWGESTRKLNDYMHFGFDIRAKVTATDPKNPYGKYMKWFLNALSGKFAQRPETDSCVINPAERPLPCPGGNVAAGGSDCRDGSLHSSANACCKHRCRRRCPRSLDVEQRIWLKPSWRLDDCAYAHWAAYLTAHARTRLHQQLVDDGRGGLSAVYCDTDSVFATEPRTWEIGRELGQFKVEGSFAEAEILAPKTYGYIDGETGEYIARSKGIPEAAYNFHLLKRGAKILVARGVETFRTAARHKDGNVNLFRRKETYRAISPDGRTIGDRVIGDDGRTTYPQNARAFA